MTDAPPPIHGNNTLVAVPLRRCGRRGTTVLGGGMDFVARRGDCGCFLRGPHSAVVAQWKQSLPIGSSPYMHAPCALCLTLCVVLGTCPVHGAFFVLFVDARAPYGPVSLLFVLFGFLRHTHRCEWNMHTDTHPHPGTSSVWLVLDVLCVVDLSDQSRWRRGSRVSPVMALVVLCGIVSFTTCSTPFLDC
ncbi:hypothetical protein MOQ_008303, partial [Trypanosoma cruzi marinkellei]